MLLLRDIQCTYTYNMDIWNPILFIIKTVEKLLYLEVI